MKIVQTGIMANHFSSRSLATLSYFRGFLNALRPSSSQAISLPILKRENPYARNIPKNVEEEKRLKQLQEPKPSNPRILSATIIGTPNAGKSTLTNALMGWRVASVSTKVHTTLHNAKAIILEDNSQIILLDTPGIVSKYEIRKHNLEQVMITDPKESVIEADIIIALVDVSKVWNRRRLDSKLLELLKTNTDKPSILVLNKVDLLRSKHVLLDTTFRLTEGIVGHKPIASKYVFKPKPERKLEDIVSDKPRSENDSNLKDPGQVFGEDKDSSNRFGWPHFERVFMISALEKDGVEDLKAYLMTQTKSGPWRYSPHIVTSEKPHEIIKQAVREKLLDQLPKEIPYNIELRIDSLEVDQHVGTLSIVVVIMVPVNRHMKLVIGENGSIVREIAEKARQDLMNTFRCDVILKLVVQLSRQKK